MNARPGKAAIFEQFAADGMSRMIGNPGTVEQGFLDVADQLPDFEYLLALHEAVAVGIGDGYARAAQAPTLVQLHSGVGLGNGIGMLYQAKRGHAPLVVVAGSAGVQYDSMDAQMAVDLVAMAKPVTKYATRVTHRESVLRTLRRAVKIAMTEPRGPVFVELPMDVLDELTTEPAVPSTIPVRTGGLAAAELDRAVELLGGGGKALVLMGDGIAVSGAQEELAGVADLLDADVYGVDSAELNMDMTDPRYRGQLGHMFGTSSAAVVGEADVVLIVGTYVFPEVFPALASPFKPGAKVVHIDLDDYEIAKNFPVDLGVVADPKAALGALAERLTELRGPATPGPRTPAPELAKDAPMAEHFAAALAEQAGDDLVVFDEALTASPSLVKHLRPRVPGSYFLTRGGSLGVGIPGAIGVKLARPGSTVVGFTGDGGSMYTIQALWTAARYGIAAKFVICDNHRYQLLDDNIEHYWRDIGEAPHKFPSAFSTTPPEIGFVELAKSLSVEAVRVEKPEEAADAVARMLAHDGPFLVDLVTG